MVRAILEGRKTQTRRVVKIVNFRPDLDINRCPFGAVGDRLWVRETWQVTDWIHPSNDEWGYIYRASENGKEWEENMVDWKWKPSIYMPREASRILLEITGVRVERLQDITDEDAIAEGVEEKEGWFLDYANGGYHASPYYSYSTLWEEINGKGSWAQNPFVWAITFKNV